MKEKRNLHLKLQEMCDCYAATNPLKEMSVLGRDQDKDDAALKWLALAVLHGVENNAEEITLTRGPDGKVTVSAAYREAELPTPGGEVGKKIVEAMREITHIEGGKGKTLLALGIRNDSLELKIKMKAKNDKEEISIEFPG
jgi:hypothetical protein